MTANNRIVMACELWHGSTGEGIAHGLRREGWDVEVVDNRNYMPSADTLAMRLFARAGAPLTRANYASALLHAIEFVQPAALVVVKGSVVPPHVVAEARRRGIVTVNYYTDFHFDYQGVRVRDFENYDLFVTTKSFQLGFLRKALGEERVRFVHHGYSALTHMPRAEAIPEDEIFADIAYIGNHTPYKEKWLLAVARAFPSARIAVVGARWAEAAKGTTLEPFVRGYQLHGDFYARAMQASRINIAIHGGSHQASGWEDLVSTRTFEIPACKGFMLHIDNDEVRTLFEPGREIGVFADEDELCAKIAHYLDCPDERAAMIERAYARCVPAYSYDARAGEISRAIQARLARR